MAGPSSTVDQNLLPVQAYFDVYGNFQTFIGQGQPFYATSNPVQSGLTITNSTLNSSPIGNTSPSTGVFTNISATTGQISTTPVNAIDIANKFYVDTVAQGLGPKAACQCATTAPITLSGLQLIDGYTTLAGDRVLVKNQSSSQYNGIYVASASAWTRAVDMDVWSEVPGAYTVILNGGQQDTGWVCVASSTGTINVTAMPWVQFSGTNTYYAGTGLSLSSNTFSITPVGTAGTYGSSSAVPVFVTNASGQITSVTNTSIAIANTQVSGLGTMSTQNANAIAVIGGSIDGTTVGATTASTVRGTTITATTQFIGPGTGLTGTATSLNIGGNAATATSAGSVTNSVTFNNGGAGGASGSTFNGGSALTVSYNTIGAPSTTGTGASGTWNIGITGNAATVTNGVYTNGSYSNPTWITSILGSIVSGAVATATLATTATNIAGGAVGALPYQSASGTTTFLALGTSNYVLTAGATAPQYVAQSTLSVGSASTATTATNLAGGLANQIAYQTGAGATSFITAPSNNTVLSYTTGGGFAWTTPTSYATVTDDTTTNATRYPLFANQTTGNLTTEYTSSTKYQFNPFTGVLTATGFSGSGASLTNLTAGNLSGTIPSTVLGNSTLYIGTTAVVLNAASGSITSLAVNISGSAASATTATTATNATNTAITDNTSSVSTWYPTIVSTTTGNLPQTTSSTKLSFVPNTGVLSATGFSGSGAGLTSIPNSALTNSTISGVALGGSLFNLTAGTGISFSSGTTYNGSAAITINATASSGVSSITGTTNQIVASASTGAVTLSLPTTVTTGAYIANQSITGSLSAGAFSYGTLGYTDTSILASFTSSTNSYNQVLVQNTNSGTSASADFVVSNNLGTASTYYGDFGMNSSGFTGTGSMNLANAVYVQSASSDLVLGTLNASSIHFVVNNGATDAATVNGTTGVWTFASTITGSISGNAGTATTATNATNVGITDDSATSSSVYLTWVTANTGNLPVKTTSTKLSFIPSTGVFNATGGVGGGAF